MLEKNLPHRLEFLNINNKEFVLRPLLVIIGLSIVIIFTAFLIQKKDIHEFQVLLSFVNDIFKTRVLRVQKGY